ncbi:TPA: hypothetical protein ACTYC5_004325 [Enterobacter hormaechei]
MKNTIIAVVAMLLLFAGYKTVNAVSDHFDYIERLEAANSTLNTNVSTLEGALNLSEAQRKAELEERKRLNGVEQNYQQKVADLEIKLSKQQEKSRDEINRLEKALLNAGVSDEPVPDDVIRMQRDRAKEINRRAREGYDNNEQQAHGNGDGLPAVHSS